MATSSGNGTASRELDQTPTWAVAAVSAVIVLISIILEKLLHRAGEAFQEKHRKALFEALEKIKGELMVLGFISLLLTFGQNYISKVCIPDHAADTMLPPVLNWIITLATLGFYGRSTDFYPQTVNLQDARRILKAWEVVSGPCWKLIYKIRKPFMLQCSYFMQIRKWKIWERDTSSDDYNDPSRFRLTHETSFVKEHTSCWTKTPLLFYTGCFFRQFFRSVRKADYLTMRHGFISVHLAPGSKFDFQKYIKRSLEDDFKVVVGISPVLWGSSVIFLLLNVHGWQAMFWLTVIPLLVILAVGTKLQAIITEMAVEILERHAVVQGIPLVQVSDKHFWFSWPRLVLHLIHFTLFQNAFQITYFFWIWYEFGLRSCFNDNWTLLIIRVAIGVVVQFLCSYITLPLYALVTQMGSHMKKSIFDEQTSKALKKWRKDALKKREGKPGGATAAQTSGGSSVDSPQKSSSNALPGFNDGGQTVYEMEEITLSPRHIQG